MYEEAPESIWQLTVIPFFADWQNDAVLVQHEPKPYGFLKTECIVMAFLHADKQSDDIF